MRKNVYKIKESVDVYVHDKTDGTSQIQFYKINTREKITINVSNKVCDLIAKIDGQNTVETIFRKLDVHYIEEEAEEFFSFLESKGIVVKQEKIDSESPGDPNQNRYSRQINYFDDLLDLVDGKSVQNNLIEKKIVIFGVGSIGSAIAINLVRAGVKSLTLIDYKKIGKSNIARHYYVVKISPPDEWKTIALSKYLKKINSECEILCINERLQPQSNLNDFISRETDFVINTADEPYIGHTTLKIGRYLWNKEIPLYVAGGFDAHLMSTGELIAKGFSPCPDCCSETFKVALKDWKPVYGRNKFQIESPSQISISNELKGIGAGGIAAQTMFSASYAAMNIINFLIGNHKRKDKFSHRGEYLINQGKMTWIELGNQKGCENCDP